jgi:hypothetical protein
VTLEQFVDELIRRARPRGYVPTIFMRMRAEYGTVSAIKRLVETSEAQSGFRRLKELGMLDWSLESAVLKFPDQFTRKTIEYARARLQGILDQP